MPVSKTLSRKALLPIGILLLVAVLGWSLTRKEQAPDVAVTTLEGQQLYLARQSGKVVLVNFWATDCPGCVTEMPQLVETYQKYKPKGFEIVAVAMPYDQPDQVRNYAAKNHLPFPVTYDSSGFITNSFQEIRVTPTTFVLDKQGRIIRKIIGEIDFPSLRQLLDAQLNGH